MCNDDQFKRMIFKQGEGPATIPVSADHRNGDWRDTDIYESEWYQDVLTGRVYTRSATGITDASGAAVPIVVVLDKSQVNGMNASPEVVFTAPSTYGARLTKEPVVAVNSDGSTFVFASGETMQFQNSMTPFTGGWLAQWGDPYITTDGTYQASPAFGGYEIVAGDITVTSSIPITGGGTDAKMTFYLEVELFKL